MKINKIALALITLAIFSCKQNTENNTHNTTTNQEKNETTHQEENVHWTYEGETGPAHWAEIEKQSDCDGTKQSPINIINIEADTDTSLKSIDIYYANNVKIHDVTNNGHTIQYDFDQGDYIMLDDSKYELKQIHFHEASEHTINGIRYPLEMHMVHVNQENKIAVLGVMAQEGESSEPFTFLENYLPVKPGETKVINTNFDLNLNLPANKAYYTYKGSLTTPPCTQGVRWYIFKTPITISLDQVKQLQDLMPINNYREEQSLNGRIVKCYNAE